MEQLLNIYELSNLLGCSVGTTRRWLALGAIPEPVRIGKRSIRWRNSSIMAWLEAGCPHVAVETETEKVEA